VSMTPDLLKYAADIISAAAKTPLGIVALFIMVLGVLAHLFFSKATAFQSPFGPNSHLPTPGANE